jgi:L-lactate dehydrogenase complex protein LldG
MIEQFIQRAQAVGAECVRAANRREALQTIEEIVGGRPAVWAGALSVESGVTRETAAQAEAGVSEMDWGVAETGTLLCDASAVEKRLVSTLPLTHIAILPEARIVADLATALAKFDVTRCGYLAAITGPSRTADIERVLTIGVHGPKRLVIVLVGDAA